MKKLLVAIFVFLIHFSCKEKTKQAALDKTVVTSPIPKPANDVPFLWEGANIYFLLTDRFHNGNKDNDINFERTNPTGPLRGFMGGDLQGITQKIEEGYFNNLGVNAIWFSPIVEQVHGDTNEHDGNTYGYHGYWAKDWTALDPNFGTEKDLKTLVEAAHARGIRILMDVVVNHTGPVTDKDPAWPENWVRTGPPCEFTNYKNTTSCTLVKNLPDILTESDEPVKLPDALLAKWKQQGRLSSELDELQLFFERTGYPRAPRFYIIKWLTDYVNDFGIDGFRVDTVKHVNENTWAELYKEANYAFETWKKKNPDDVLDDTPFFMVGEVYNYNISNGREFDFGDKKVDYFKYGFKSLINFELKQDALNDYETVFSKYSRLLHTKLAGKGVLNYLSSHDDLEPFDKQRQNPFKAANTLLLTPGASQIYYGDETSRSLIVAGAEGDATLRSFMNWEELENLPDIKEIHSYWQKLGRFRSSHPAIGAGKHRILSKKPYVFSRTYVDGAYRDKVVIGLDLPKGQKSLKVKGFFGDGTHLYDSFSETEVIVQNGNVILDNDNQIALLEVKR